MDQEKDKISIQVGEPTGLLDEETEDSMDGCLSEETLVDILDGGPLPEFLDIDEAILLRCALPIERVEELSPHLKNFIGEDYSMKDYDYWYNMALLAKPDSFEKKLGVLMMSLAASTFADWLALYHLVNNQNQPILEKFSAQMMLRTAQSPAEHKKAHAKAMKAGLTQTEKKHEP